MDRLSRRVPRKQHGEITFLHNVSYDFDAPHTFPSPLRNHEPAAATITRGQAGVNELQDTNNSLFISTVADKNCGLIPPFSSPLELPQKILL